jgi:branched-chain amino acid transport system substrate-binding protein
MTATSVFARGTALAVAAACGFGLSTASAQDKESVTIAVATFLSGAAAPAFGVPARNGAEIVMEAINKGALPEPYNTKGIAGLPINPLIYDEAGGNTKQVTEFRNKVQKDNVDLFAGFTSSGTCQALTPVAEQLEVLTIYATCGTPRVFEELDPDPKYVFRTMSHATADNVAAAHYAKAKFSATKGYTGINQNYAWGQDSYRDFDLAMKSLMPEVTASDKPQWPKIFAGQYGAEVSALLLAQEDLIHTSFWGGDLEAFIFQGSARGLFKQKNTLFTVAGTAVYRLKKKMPEGVALGARGPYGIFAAAIDNPLNNWFRAAYVDRYGTQPTGPSYQYAQAILAAKFAYDKAAADNGGKFPSTDQVIAALEGAKIPSFSTTVEMALNKGHQGITDHVYGLTAWDAENGEPTVQEVVKFKARCVMPPDGVNSVEWIEGGMQGADCS